MVDVNYLILRDSVVVNHNNENYTVHKDDKHYSDIKKAIIADDMDELLQLVNNADRVKEYVTDQEFVIIDGQVFSHGKPVNNYISDRLIAFSKEKIPYQFLLNFWKLLQSNPSQNSIAQLYPFLEKAKCPITRDGHFIAYKAVRKTMFDKHTNSVRYDIGVMTTQDRDTISDDPECACGSGLHVGSYDYAKQFASGTDIIIEVKVNPKDVVSVPSDANQGKCRCCAVLPIGICEKKIVTEVAVSASNEKNLEPSYTPDAESITFLINKKQYNREKIREIVFKEYVSLDGVVRVRPSKMPKNVRSAHTKIMEGYRYVSVKKTVYLVADADDTFWRYVPMKKPAL